MKWKKGLFAGLGIGLAIFKAIDLHAQSFNGAYNFAGVTTSSGTTDPTAPPASTGVTFGSFTAVGYSGNPSASGRFSWNGNPTGGADTNDNFASFTGSLNTSLYYEVTLTPQAFYTLNIDTLSFGIRRSSTGIRSYAVRSSLDGFAANLLGSINPANTNLGIAPDGSFRWLYDSTSTGADQTGSRVVFDAAYDALTGPITFRFYGWNAESSVGTFSIDDVQFSGSVTAVPEPGTVALASAAALGMWASRRRKVTT